MRFSGFPGFFSEDCFDDSLLSNMDPADRPFLEQAIKQSGVDDRVYISDKAYDCYGRPLPTLIALHCVDRRTCGDLGHFWREFERIKAEAPTCNDRWQAGVRMGGDK